MWSIVTGAFERFRNGLKTLGVLDAITNEPRKLQTLNERIVTFWRDYLQDVEEKEGPSKLGKILAFATGATIIPPAGFSPQPSIEFLHEQSIHPSRQLPMANTCINPLKLPMLETNDHFKESMDFALGNAHGYRSMRTYVEHLLPRGCIGVLANPYILL
uniref:HECT domain-containing protein n=1 Tax=Poecilia reticulata TaxID=8081 RepID=A0A3P9NPD8_POERE